MRRILISMLAMLLCFQSATAYDFKVKGIAYKKNDDGKSVRVTGCRIGGAITIPKSVMDDHGATFSVTRIGNMAFEGCTGLTSISIPNSVTEIGDMAFLNCVSLTSISMSNSVSKIGYSAFSGTPWYNNQPDGMVYIENVAYRYKGEMPSNTSVAIKKGVVSVSSGAFEGCRGLTSITIPNSVTTIGTIAFRGCAGLSSVIIPNSVTEIGRLAFYGCLGLTSVAVPSSVSKIGSDAFFGTPWYNNQDDGVVYIGKVAYKYKGEMPKNTSVVIKIKDGIESVSPSAFEGCVGLTSVAISNTVTEIGYMAFDGCAALTSVTIGTSVTEIGDMAFRNCKSLISASIPNSVTTIGKSAFQWLHESYICKNRQLDG